MKTRISAFVLLLIALLSYGTTSAQSVNVKSLTATDLGTQLRVVFDVAGLGNVSSTPATVTFDAVLKTQCVNPSGKNSPPGQDQELNNFSQTEDVMVRNGRARGTILVPKEGFTVTAAEAGCPNSMFTPIVTDAIFSNIVFTIGGESFTIGDPAIGR